MNDRGLPRVTHEKQQWLKALASYSVIGTLEMNAAAKEIGWDPTPEALRALKKKYVDARYMIEIGRGTVQLNKSRIELGLGFDIFADDDKAEPDERNSVSTASEDGPGYESKGATDVPVRPGGPGDLDFLDDDVPF